MAGTHPVEGMRKAHILKTARYHCIMPWKPTTFILRGLNPTENPSFFMVCLRDTRLGGGFKHFLCSSLLGEKIQFDGCIFFRCVETTN